MKATYDFFDFEVNNKMFDIKDKKGFIVWESIRYFAFCKIVRQWGSLSQHTDEKTKVLTIFIAIKNLFQFFIYLIRHRNSDTMFFLCSRDKKNNLLYDKILGSIFDEANKKKSFAIESHDSFGQSNYKYKGQTCSTILLTILFKLFRNKKYNSEIDKILSANYQDKDINFSEMRDAYGLFYSQYYFYRFLFRFCKIRKLFLVQNGIQKGMFAAAKECGVKVLELQHGQVSDNHPAYSYPKEMVDFPEKIYAPDIFLTFGNFWMKNSVFPGVKIEPLGNDFYAQSGSINSIENVEKKILVISSYIHGEVLSQCVKEISEKDSSFSFYFKLHPNEFEDIEKYQRFFAANDKIRIVTNEATVTELLGKTEFVLLIQSTAELEALRNGKKVIILRKLDYEALDFVFREKGIFFIDNAADFLNCYKAHKDELIEPRTDIFQPFDKDKALNLLKC